MPLFGCHRAQVASFVEPDDGQLRFEVELEFVQLLANPAYIHRKIPAPRDYHKHILSRARNIFFFFNVYFKDALGKSDQLLFIINNPHQFLLFILLILLIFS